MGRQICVFFSDELRNKIVDEATKTGKTTSKVVSVIVDRYYNGTDKHSNDTLLSDTLLLKQDLESKEIRIGELMKENSTLLSDTLQLKHDLESKESHIKELTKEKVLLQKDLEYKEIHIRDLITQNEWLKNIVSMTVQKRLPEPKRSVWDRFRQWYKRPKEENTNNGLS